MDDKLRDAIIEIREKATLIRGYATAKADLEVIDWADKILRVLDERTGRKPQRKDD